MIIEKKFFNKGIDADSMLQLIAQEAYLNLINGRTGVTQYGRGYSLQNFPGTTAISQSVLPPYGTNQCLGSGVDIARNRILYALYNSVGYHGIYCRDLSAGITYAVLYDSQVIGGLDFDKSYRIDKNMYVIGDMLYWTDNNNQPRRINIEAGIKMNHASYVTDVTPYDYPMTQSVIALIRRPFGLALTTAKATDGTITTNYVAGFAGQFASRLIYRDGEYSVVNTPSAMVNYNLPADTFNAIDVTFDINEDFDQDVQEVQAVVRFGNNPNYFVVKSWNKDVAAEAAEIAAHNAGATALTFRFYNDKSGIAVSQEDSVKPFDSVPLRVKTQALALNRLMLSNYLKGYDTPTTTSLTGGQTSSSVNPTTETIFESGGIYQIAVRFRDDSGRMSSVVTNEDLVIRIPERDYDGSPYVTAITWAISNALATTEIPDWAYYYDILISKNLSKRFFISDIASLIQYVVKNSDGTYSYQTNYLQDCYGIAIDISVLTGRGLGYVFEAGSGDSCKLYIISTATVYDLPVIGQDGNNVILKLQDIGSLASIPPTVFKIYTPYKQQEDESFYTCGQTYTVTNPATGSRVYSTLSGSILGDITRIRTTYLTTPYVYEAMSPNDDYWQDWFAIYGAANIESLLGQVEKTNFIQWSNTIIQGSRTNGLSTFDALDEKPLPENMGAVTKLQLASKIQEQGNIMLAIGEKETASLYLGEVQVVGASKNAFLAQQEGVIGTINILQGSYGTTMPSSVIEYLGLVFWYDLANGCYVQYSQAGLEPVSRYNMTRFFKNYAAAYNTSSTGNLDNINGFHHIPGFVDPFHKEVGATLPALIYDNYANTLPSYSAVPSYASSIIDRFDVYDQLGKRMAFTYEENKFGANFEGLGEEYTYIQDRMFSFKDGAMWEHHTNTSEWNTVYGVQYPVRICFVANLNPSLLKVLNNICVEGTVIPDFAVAMTTWPNTQLSDLAGDDEAWVNQEGNLYAAWLRDRLSPNSSGTAEEKLFTGDSLTDTAILCMLEFQRYESLITINFVDLGYSASRGQKQIANP